MATQNYQVGGWYNGRQWTGTSFGAPGQITVGEAAGTMVNPAVVAASNIQQGLAPGTNEAYLASQGASGYSSGATGGGGDTTGTATDPYSQAASDIKATIPLIQERYKTLLDEIERATTEGAQAEERATTGQIGETQARAAAAGTFAGTTELGTEDIIRKQAADTIASIKQSGASKKAQAAAQEAIDIGQVTEKLANLAIAKDKADRDAAQFAMNYILEKRKVDISASTAGGAKLLSPAEAASLGVPYGTTEADAAKMGIVPSTSGGGSSTFNNIYSSIKSTDKNVLNSTGQGQALLTYAKLNTPIIGQTSYVFNAQDAAYKELQGKYFTLVQGFLKEMQGSRPSDYDVKSYMQNIGMGIDKSPASNQAALNTLLAAKGTSGGGANAGVVTQSDGSQWKQNPDGSYTRIK